MTQQGDTVRLDRAGEFQAEVPRSELLDLYRITVDEYRFVVKFNWDRTQYFFVLSTAMATAGGTLLATLKPWSILVAIFVFAVGCFTAMLGRQVVITGHRYYRRVVHRKTLLEDLLGRLHKLPGYPYEDARLNLSTTAGMEESEKILRQTEAYLAEPLKRGSITFSLRAIFLAFVLLDAAGTGLAIVLLYRS